MFFKICSQTICKTFLETRIELTTGTWETNRCCWKVHFGDRTFLRNFFQCFRKARFSDNGFSLALSMLKWLLVTIFPRKHHQGSILLFFIARNTPIAPTASCFHGCFSATVFLSFFQRYPSDSFFSLLSMIKWLNGILLSDLSTIKGIWLLL